MYNGIFYYTMKCYDNYIADICGIDGGSAYFLVGISPKRFRGRETWSKFYTDFKKNQDITNEMNALGFCESNGSFFRPLKIDVDLLASAYVNDDYKEAFKPFDEAFLAIEADQGRRLLAIYLKAPAHGRFLVVIPLIQNPAVFIANARDFGRMETDMIGVAAGSADAASADSAD